MIKTEDTLPVGVITRSRGTSGELLCMLGSTLWESLRQPEFVALNLQNILVPFRLEDWWYKNDEAVVLCLKGIDSELSAGPLIGAEVRVFRKDVAETEDGSDVFTWQDLVGFILTDASGRQAGRIVQVDETTANIIAKTDTGLLFPLHEDLITGLDRTGKSITVNAMGI